MSPLIYKALAQGALLALCLSVQLGAQQQTPQFAKLNIHDDFIWSRGVWLPDNLTEKNEPIPSVTDFACYRHGGALLVNSEAYCILATAQIIDGEPNVDVMYYPVLSWSKTRLSLRTLQQRRFQFVFGQKSRSILRIKPSLSPTTEN